MAVALVTGPTSGLGEGFARRLAGDGYDVVLVARDGDRLSALAADLERSGVRAEVIVADLADRDSLAAVEARLSDPGRPVDVLVNNAGFGLHQPFVGGSLDTEQAAIDVMVTAVMRLTHAALPGMRQRGNGTLINVSSIASFLPFGSYSAAKAWVTMFTQSLVGELAGSGVRTVAVCPGLVHTRFHERAGMDMSRTPDWLWLSVADVVDQAMADVSRGKSVSIAGAQYRSYAVAARLAPRGALTRVRAARQRVLRP